MKIDYLDVDNKSTEEKEKKKAEFTVDESCGKCTPCRIGTKRMLEILEKLWAGQGTESDIHRLEKLAKNIQTASVCGLGQSAPNPVLSTLKYFREEFHEHAAYKQCRALECKALSKITINAEKCKGCGLCQKQCPVNAIEGEGRDKRIINQEKCIKCGNGGIGWFRFFVLLDNVMYTSSFGHLPKDVHNLDFGFGQCIGFGSFHHFFIFTIIITGLSSSSTTV